MMEQCQFVYNAIPNLWKISYAEVDAFGKNNAEWELKTAIFEEADAPIPYQNAIPWMTVFKRKKCLGRNIMQRFVDPHSTTPLDA